jgi:hypothetical protein
VSFIFLYLIVALRTLYETEFFLWQKALTLFEVFKMLLYLNIPRRWIFCALVRSAPHLLPFPCVVSLQYEHGTSFCQLNVIVFDSFHTKDKCSIIHIFCHCYNGFLYFFLKWNEINWVRITKNYITHYVPYFKCLIAADA